VLNMLQQMGLFALFSLTVSVVPAVAGVAYALWPTEAKLALMRPLSLAGLFGGLSGLVVGLINSLTAVAKEGAPLALTPGIVVGTAESLVALGVAFTSLTLAWLLVALGMRRQG
jgi:hypothetical protein